MTQIVPWPDSARRLMSHDYHHHFPFQRRASDPSGNFNNLMKTGSRIKPPAAGPELGSEGHGPDHLAEDSVNELEAGDPRDGKSGRDL